MAAKNLLEAEKKGFGEIPADIWDLQQCSLVAQEKRVARCAKGKLALVLRAALPGDSVCILIRSKTPVVLKIREGDEKVKHCQFVGQCYYEGAMYGEAIEMKEASYPYFLVRVDERDVFEGINFDGVSRSKVSEQSKLK